MITLSRIENFLEDKQLIIAGASRNEKKFGHVVYKTLRDKGYKVCALNPNADEILGDPSYKSVTDLPEDFSKLYIVTPKQETDRIIKEAAAKGIKDVWVQQGSQSNDTINLASESGINIITGKCILMFAEPVGSIHKFHRGLAKFFGRYPKNQG